MKGRGIWVSSPYHSSQKYHEQGQDQDNSAAQVGMTMFSQLVVRTVNEIKGHLFLGRSPGTCQTQGYRYGPHGTLEASNPDTVGPGLTSSSSHPYRAQCRTTLARFRFQISRNTVAAVSTGECHSTPPGEPGWLKSSGWLAPGSCRDTQQQLTPQSHEDGKHHSAVIVKEMSELERGAEGLSLLPMTPHEEGKACLFRASRCFIFPTSR